jgi:DNA-binding transcriptional regulator YiaG
MQASFSARILAARKKLGIGQKKAAKAWGFNAVTIQAWEKGRRQPAGLYKQKLERILRKIEKGPP